MQLAFSTLLGMPVTEDREGERLGVVSGALFDADHGSLEGVYVLPANPFSRDQLFVQAQDILRTGLALHVRDSDRLVLPHDLVRLAPLLNDSRTIIGQRVVTEASHRRLGRCADIVVDTQSFNILKIIPRKFFLRYGRPIPKMDIVEITPEAIVVREPDRLVPVETEPEKESAIAKVGELLTPPSVGIGD